MDATPYLSEYRFNDLGVHAMGLMDLDMVDRVVQVSKVMRENGIPTEFPREVKIIEEIWIENEDGSNTKVKVKEWKKQRAKECRKELSNIFWGKLTFKTDLLKAERKTYLNNALKYLDKSQFVILTRDVQSDTRLQDIESAAKTGELKETMDPIFRWLNTAMKYRDKGLIPGTPRCKDFTTSNEDLIRYFGEYYPANAGMVTGRIRGLEIHGGFMHIGNWQGVPTPLDLDSFTGKKIYETDGVPSEEDYARDLTDSVDSISSLISGVFKNKKILGDIDYDALAKKASKLFLTNYLLEAFDKDITKEKIELTQDKMLGSNQKYADLLEEIKKDIGLVNSN